MTEFVPYLISGAFLIAAGVVGGIFGARNRRRQELIPVPPTWPEILTRFDLQDRKINALGRLLVSAVDQHPADAPPLLLNPEDLEIVADTLPANWRRTPPRGSNTAPQS